MYNLVWSKCNFNSKTGGPITNLNKELQIANKNIDEADKSDVITRKLDYCMQQWKNTDNPMSQEEWDRKYDWFMKHGFRLQFVHQVDIKFRHSTSKFAFFYQVKNFPINNC